MATGLIDIMKRAAMDAEESGQPCDLRTGTVESISPLRVKISSQMIIPQSLLVVPQHLTNYSVEVLIEGETASVDNHTHDYEGNTVSVSGGADAALFASHSHPYEGTTKPAGSHAHDMGGKKKLTIYNALKVGDKVALLRKKGGQSYFILDRI